MAKLGAEITLFHNGEDVFYISNVDQIAHLESERISQVLLQASIVMPSRSSNGQFWMLQK
jgi:hypothetical protein